MKSATNIKELYQVLTPSKFLTQKEAEFYVDVYGDQIKMIRNTVFYNENPHHTVYVSGLSGSGKTTALNFLPDEKLEAEYEVRFLFGNELFDLADIDIIDVLLMLCFNLVDGEKALESKFLEELNDIQESIRGQYEEFEEKEKKHQMSTGAKAEGEFETNPLLKWLFAFTEKASFFTDYRYNRDKRTVARKIFRPHISDLLKMTNQIIVAYMSKKGDNKQLLLIFHELNHIKNLEVIRHLFIDNRYSLERIHAKKVVTIPVALMPMPLSQILSFWV